MNIESAIKYLSVVALIYILARTLAPGFRDFLKEKVFGIKTPTDTDNLDDMIRRKQEILKTAHGGLSKEQSDKTIQQYKKSSDPDLKETLQIISDLQWGESPILKSWVEEVNYQKGLDIKSQIGVQLLKQIFHGPKAGEFPHPLSPKETKNLFFSICETYSLAKAQGGELQNWMKAHLITERQWKRALNFVSKHNFTKQKALNKEILSEDDSISESQLINIAASLAAQRNQVDLCEIQNRLKEAALLFAILDLPSSEKKSLPQNEALSVFQFSEAPSDEETLKQRKKALIKGRHPDKIAHFHLSKDLEKIATQRYQMIEIAYNTILKMITD